MFSEDEAFYNYDNMSPTWHALESSYPELDDEGVVDWKPIADAIRWMSFSDETEVNAHLADKFDLDVWEDYFLFVEFLMADDNIYKGAATLDDNVGELVGFKGDVYSGSMGDDDKMSDVSVVLCQ